MLQRDDSLASLVNRDICVIFSKKRKLTRNQGELGEGREIYLTHPPNAMRENVFTPAVRRGLVKYWVDITKEFPAHRCAEMMGSLHLIGDEFGATLLPDAEEFCRSMLSHREKLQNVNESSDTPAGIAQGGTFGDACDMRGIQDHIGTLLRARRATSGTHLRLYKLRDLPDDVFHGLKTSTSLKNKSANIENVNNAIDAINEANLLPLFGRTTKKIESHRLDSAKYIRLVTGEDFVGAHKRWADIYDIR